MAAVPVVQGDDVIATSQPLAAAAGMRMYESGGNAVDAALAAAIALTVVEPVSTGVGGDGFAMLWDGRQPHGLNASGRSPAGWDAAFLAELKTLPARGWNSVTVPGVVAMWRDLSARFGKLPFGALFGPAIGLARGGFTVSPGVAKRWEVQVKGLAAIEGFSETFMPGGAAPAPGQLIRFPALGATLEEIAETDGRSFYEGRLAETMAAHSRECGGRMALRDLAVHRNVWTGTVRCGIFGCELHEMPPNTQGLVVPMALKILSAFDWRSIDPDSGEGMHLQIEAFKLASADIARWLGDPAFMALTPAAFLNDAYLAGRAKMISGNAQRFGPGLHPEGGTVVVTAADRAGNAISLLQSNYVGFGSGVVVPGTGISLHNRAAGFSLEADWPNGAAREKRPLHSLLPAMVMKHDAPLMALGVSGGNMQPQGQIQLLLRILVKNMPPQEAIDAPRYRHMEGLSLNLEDRVPEAVRSDLARRGHRTQPIPRGYMDFGSAQVVHRRGTAWLAATDARKDGTALARQAAATSSGEFT